MEIEIQNVNKIIAKFCHNMINEPLSFFSESDLQALLFRDLINDKYFGNKFIQNAIEVGLQKMI